MQTRHVAKSTTRNTKPATPVKRGEFDLKNAEVDCRVIEEWGAIPNALLIDGNGRLALAYYQGEKLIRWDRVSPKVALNWFRTMWEIADCFDDMRADSDLLRIVANAL